MAMAQFIHDGGTIDYIPPADVTAGDVIVQGDLVGVAKLDIPSGKLGALAVVGVFDFAKATGGGTALTAGTTAYWDDTAKVATQRRHQSGRHNDRFTNPALQLRLVAASAARPR